jgi:hypothetical protein
MSSKYTIGLAIALFITIIVYNSGLISQNDESLKSAFSQWKN